MILGARGASAEWEPASGHLPRLVIGGADVLWRAPWRNDPAVQVDCSIPLVDRRLGGTFVCAPFGADDVDGGPPHGRPANGAWRVLHRSHSALVAETSLPRGRLRARLTFRDSHPALYQQHLLDLHAPSTFAHHPMIRAGGGATLTTSARSARTFPPMEALSAERLPADAVLDPSALERLPEAPGCDFVTLVHTPEGLGWTAVAREQEGDAVLFLKRSEQLPVTNLWLWNGGRQESPWRGLREGVIGVEDARCAGADGFRAALEGRSRIEGVPLCFPPGRHAIAHAVLRIADCGTVRDVRVRRDALEVATDEGRCVVPFDGTHLA